MPHSHTSQLVIYIIKHHTLYFDGGFSQYLGNNSSFMIVK